MRLSIRICRSGTYTPQAFLMAIEYPDTTVTYTHFAHSLNNIQSLLKNLPMDLKLIVRQPKFVTRYSYQYVWKIIHD